MTTGNLSELSNEQLLQKSKKLKTDKLINAVLVGFTIGIVIYGSVKNGFGLSTFFPLILAYIIIKNAENSNTLEKEIQKELKTRGAVY